MSYDPPVGVVALNHLALSGFERAISYGVVTGFASYFDVFIIIKRAVNHVRTFSEL